MGFIHDRVAAAGHTVDYICAEDVPVNLRRLARFSFPLLVCRLARRALRADRPYDILNVHEPSAAATVAFRKYIGTPFVVVTSHGIESRAWELALEESRWGRLTIPLKSRIVYPATSLWQSGYALRNANHVFCLNSEDADYLIDHFGRCSEDITRIYPGADLDYARASENRDYNRAKRIAFAGSWLQRKGIHDLVGAFAILHARHTNLELCVLGSGLPSSAVLADFPLQCRSSVTCIPTLTSQQMADELKAADIYLLPSLFEGTPLTLIEAMMSGLPVITTSVCGMKDLVVHGQTGLLVPIRSPHAIVEAVEMLLADPLLRARLGNAASQEASLKYNWDTTSAIVLDAYTRLANPAVSEVRPRSV